MADPDSLVSGDLPGGGVDLGLGGIDPSRSINVAEMGRNAATADQPLLQTAQLAPPAPVQLAPGVPPQMGSGTAAPPAARPGTGQGPFGSNVNDVPTTIAPDADPLDVEIANMKAQRDQLQAWGADKSNQFWEKGKANLRLQAATELSGKIKEKEQEKQTQMTNQQTAKNWELTKVMPRTTDAAAIREEAVREWKDEGNLNAYTGLKGAGDPRADLYLSDGINAASKKVDEASKLFKRLENVGDNAQYQSVRKEVLAQAGDKYRTLGLSEDKIPKTKPEFEARRTEIMGKFDNAQVFIATYNRQQAELKQFVPITDEKVAPTVTKTKQFSNGEAFPNTNAVSNAALGGIKGAQMQPGSRDLANRGSEGKDGYTDMNPAVKKQVTEELASEEYKGAIGQYKIAKSFHAAAYNDKLYNYPAGLAFLDDELGALGRDVAEGSKAAGSVGLVRILHEKYGNIDNAMNSMTNNWGAFKAWVQGGRKGEEVKLEPRVTGQTIEGYKVIADFKLDETKKELSRLEGPIATLGRYGGSLKQVGLDKETQELLRDVHQEAILKGRLDIDKYPSIITGTSRVVLPEGTAVPPGTPGFVPAGSYAKTLSSIPTTPDTTPPAASTTGPVAPTPPPAAGPTVPGGGGPAAPGAKPLAPSTPGGGGGPTAPGGTGPRAGGPNDPLANVDFASYATGISAGESGHNPAKGSPAGSSAGGLFQMVQGTWDKHKPPGAPDRPEKATAEQQGAAMASFTRENAIALQKANIPVNALSLAIAHQQGAGGAKALLTASDDALAKDQVGRKEAANNAPFFWDKSTGKPLTVAESKAKFAQFYRTDGSAAGTAGGGRATAEAAPPQESLWSRANRLFQSGARGSGPGGRVTPSEATGTARAAAHMLPAAGGTVGGAVGGVPGALVGGAAGGAAEHYLVGPPEAQAPSDYIMPTATGAVKGAAAVIPGGPIAGPLMRMGASGAIGAGEEALKGGDAREIAAAGGAGVLGAAGGELFGMALGATFSKIYKAFSSGDQAAVQAAGKVLAEQQPKKVLADGSTVDNPAYLAAEKTVKDRGIDPEFAAHAHNEVARQATRGEAFVGRPGATARAKAGAELEDIKNQVGETAAAARVTPRAMPPNTFIPNGPMANLNSPTNPSGKIGAQYRPEVSQAEATMQRPAGSVSEKWGNVAEARETLLKHERTAKIAGDTDKADTMREAANIVRDHQEKIIRALMPKEKAEALIQHNRVVNDRYRQAMLASDKDIVAKVAKGDAEGNQIKTAWDTAAKNDPTAKAWLNSLVAAHDSSPKGDAFKVVATAAGGLAAFPLVHPVAGVVLGLVSAETARRAVVNYMTQKAANKMVTFKDLIMRDLTPIKQGIRRGSAAMGGAAGTSAMQQALEPAAPASP